MAWLRRLIRRKTNPVSIDKSVLWKRRLSMAYAFLAWNAFGLIAFLAYKGTYKKDDAAHIAPGIQWAETLKVKNAKFYKLSGFNVVEVDKEAEFQKAVKKED